MSDSTRVGRKRPRIRNVVIPETVALDPNLLDKHRGLLIRLLFLPESQTFAVRDLVTQGTGRDAVYAGLNALIELGYAERITCKDPQTGRFIGTEIWVREEGFFASDSSFPENPHTAEPDRVEPPVPEIQESLSPSSVPENPDSAFSGSGNSQQLTKVFKEINSLKSSSLKPQDQKPQNPEEENPSKTVKAKNPSTLSVTQTQGALLTGDLAPNWLPEICNQTDRFLDAARHRDDEHRNTRLRQMVSWGNEHSPEFLGQIVGKTLEFCQQSASLWSYFCTAFENEKRMQAQTRLQAEPQLEHPTSTPALDFQVTPPANAGAEWELWLKVVEKLKNSLLPIEFNTWMPRLTPSGLHQGYLRLHCASEFVRDWASKNLELDLREAVRGLAQGVELYA